MAGDYYGRGQGEICGRVLSGTETGLNCRFAGIDAAGRVTDRGGDEGGSDAGEGDGGDAGKDIGERSRTVWGVAERGARRLSAGGGAGMLGSKEGGAADLAAADEAGVSGGEARGGFGL